MKKLLALCALLASTMLVAMTVVPAASAAPLSTAEGAPRFVGFYIPGVPADMTALSQLESSVATHAAVVNFFIGDGEAFPRARCASVADHGSVPLVTLNFDSLGTGPVSSITNGDKDAYLERFATDAKAFGGELWLRPFNEMNGNWMPWSGTINGNSPASVVAAWKHVRDIFSSAGATNVKFVWCMNTDSVPDTTGNAIRDYWPGDAYVDLVALDGYNWGTGASWSSWQSFGQVFGRGYAAVTSLTSKPLIIAETASAEQGGDKSAWISDMFRVIPSTYARIRGVVWFNANKERDWRIESAGANVTAFKSAALAWTPAAAGTPPTKRLKRYSGSNRYTTAVAISSQKFSSAETVIVATGLDYADALAASPLAGALHAPVLLVPGSSIPASVTAEIRRLGAGKVVIAGGPAAVSTGVEKTFAADGLAVERIAGSDRYETASAIARRVLALTGKTSAEAVFIARGDSFADALSVSSTAYNKRFPILLVRPASLPAPTGAALRDLAPRLAVIAGGRPAISSAVAGAVAKVSASTVRVGGTDRYGTSTAIADFSVKQGWAGADCVGFATGADFADALGGGPACGDSSGILLLTDPATLPATAVTFLQDHDVAFDVVSIFGGTSAVRTTVETDLGAVLQ